MPEIVNAFKPPDFSDPPENFIEKNFQKDVETVEDFQRRIHSIPEAEAEQEFFRIFLLGLVDSKVGLYSKLHDNAIYKDGYDDQETIRLAYM
jgi:RNA-dependent RNA polymerase